jgi:1,4-alpha-glucan branching enzyme
MTKAKPIPKTKGQKVTFLFEAAEAREVFLSGDFNNWDPKAHPMKNDGNGRWSRTLMIAPGKYEYKFLADGQWVEDPRNDQICPNGFGTYNSVLNLKSK